MDEEKLRKACSDFEAIFIQQMLRSMRQTVPNGGVFGGTTSKESILSLFDEELSKSLARRGGIGLGRMLQKKVLQRQGGIPSRPPSHRVLQKAEPE